MSELGITFPGVSTTSGITEAEHEVLDTLVHGVAETGFVEIVRNAENKVDVVNVRVSDGGTLIRSTTITRGGGGAVTQTTENQHDAGGAIIQTITTDINRSGGKVVSLDTTEV